MWHRRASFITLVWREYWGKRKKASVPRSMPCTVCTIYVLCCTVCISIDTQESQDQSNVCILYLLLPHDDGGKVHAENNGMAWPSLAGRQLTHHMQDIIPNGYSLRSWQPTYIIYRTFGSRGSFFIENIDICNKQQNQVQSDRCKIPSDGIPISSNQPIFGIPSQTKLMQI